MNNELHLVGPREGLSIQNCLEKLRQFCKYDAFPGYDLVGYRHLQQADVLQSELLSATNSAMRARSSRKAWDSFLDRPLAVLRDLPIETDLIECSDAEYRQVREQLGLCYTALTSAAGITDMAASKMLYLKRPRLVAISDSYVREALAVDEPDLKAHPWRAPYCTARALAVADAVRAVGQTNAEVLEDLFRVLAAELAPSTVSKARIVDILVWTDMAIARPGIWSRLAEVAGWSSIGWDLRAAQGAAAQREDQVSKRHGIHEAGR